MGSCGSGVGGIGPIVWVRRRNGSWWPGKILGPKELSECNLSSPRTGTPVKLLGREDASVDWYNLEKSKRVKAFRCGEFDECIEKAESAHGLPIKKREKYARREDAILHALDLEKQLMTDPVKPIVPLISSASKSSAPEKKKVAVATDVPENNSKNLGNGRLAQSSKDESDVKHESEVSHVHSSWEEENPETIPRMKGLQDLGVRTAQPKRRFGSVECDLSGRETQFPMSSAPTLEKISYINGGDQMGSIYRGKRSRCIYSSTGMDDREISFDMIKRSPRSENYDVNHQRLLLKEGNSSSGVMEDDESDYSQSDSMDSDSDSSETEPDTNDVTVSSDLGHDEARGDQESTSIEEPEDSAFSGDIAHLYPDDPYRSNEAVSKWQLKGKRNIRPMPMINGKHTRSSLKPRNGAKTTALHEAAYDWEGRPCSGQWENGRQCINTLSLGRHNGRTRPMLIEVELKVQSRYQREKVPIISLLSKLDGMAIIGHPIQTEPMEDGSSATLLSNKEEYSQTAQDWNPSLPPAWKSARRRNFRAPRPNVSSLNTDELDYEHERRFPVKRSNVANLSQNSSLLRKGLTHNRFSRKASKKQGLSSSQKTRTLSSIGSHQSFGNKVVLDNRSFEMDKRDMTAPPTVACIPVKLVFSRLLEKINRPPSNAVK